MGEIRMKLTEDEILHKFEPTGVTIVVKIDKAKKQTAGGIYLPDDEVDANTQATNIGTVISKGEHCYKGRLAQNMGSDKHWCEVGDKIFFKQFIGTRLLMVEEDLKDHYYRLINDEDVKGVIRD